MAVIVNEFEIVVEAPGGEDGAAAQPGPREQAKPVPRVLKVQDLERVRRDMDLRARRLEAD